MLDGEFSDNFEEIIQNLGDRIEDIERTLNEDEDFCNKDIDATYQAALKYLKTFEIKFNEKLIELKIQLDRIRDENLQTSKQNKQQFDEEIDEINQLFSSGKHQEALEKFHKYEEHFQQRTTNIQNIPKLYMQDIDINRYFSIDKPITIPEIPKQEHVKQTKRHLSEEINEQECFDIRFRQPNNQQIVKPNKESQPSVPIITSRPQFFSTRLSTSSSVKSLSINDYDLNTTTLSKQTNTRNSHDNITNRVPVRSTLSSPNILPSLTPTPIMKASRIDGLSPKYIAAYQHEQNTSAFMTCNQNSIILLRSQANRVSRWYSIRFDRSNLKDTDCKWHNLVIKSIGFIDQNFLYIFTEREFLIYSSDLSIKYHSRVLLTANNYHSEYNNIHLGFGGTVYNQYIYHLYLNIKDHWILSILDLETINHIFDHDLTEIFPDVKNFIDIYIKDQMINFLVEIDGSQYAVLFCSNSVNSKIEFKRCIQLSYAEKPHRIRSVFIPYIHKEIYFINDPSAKIIHLLTQEKYLQSYSIIAHTLCYIEDNQELILASNDGLYSIHINEQQNFFSKFH